MKGYKRHEGQDIVLFDRQFDSLRIRLVISNWLELVSLDKKNTYLVPHHDVVFEYGQIASINDFELLNAVDVLLDVYLRNKYTKGNNTFTIYHQDAAGTKLLLSCKRVKIKEETFGVNLGILEHQTQIMLESGTLNDGWILRLQNALSKSKSWITPSASIVEFIADTPSYNRGW